MTSSGHARGVTRGPVRWVSLSVTASRARTAACQRMLHVSSTRHANVTSGTRFWSVSRRLSAALPRQRAKPGDSVGFTRNCGRSSPPPNLVLGCQVTDSPQRAGEDDLDVIVAIFAVDQREWPEDDSRIYDEAGRWREGLHAVYRHRASKIRALVAEQCAQALEALDPVEAALAGQAAFQDAADHLRSLFGSDSEGLS